VLREEQELRGARQFSDGCSGVEFGYGIFVHEVIDAERSYGLDRGESAHEIFERAVTETFVGWPNAVHADANEVNVAGQF
jgi:hypothetical protein